MIQSDRLQKEDYVPARFNWEKMIRDAYTENIDEFFIEPNPIIKMLIIPLFEFHDDIDSLIGSYTDRSIKVSDIDNSNSPNLHQVASQFWT